MFCVVCWLWGLLGWFVMWCLSVTEPSNVISILISSEFLKMDTLVSVVTCDARCGGVLSGGRLFSHAVQGSCVGIVLKLNGGNVLVFLLLDIWCKSFSDFLSGENKRPTDIELLLS